MAKRRRGHIRKRGANYYIVLTVNGRKQEMVVGPSLEVAEKLLTERLREYDLGFTRSEKPTSFKTFTETWWPSFVALSNLKPSTTRSYKSILDARLLPHFGSHRIDRITPAMIAKYFTELSTSKSKTTGEILKSKTLRNCRILLQQIFDYAVAIRMIGRSPIEKKLIRLPSVTSAERDFLRAEEIPLLIDALPDADSKCVVFTAIATGLRQGELFALGWEHIDLERKVVKVRRAFSEGVLGTPKTKQSIRDVKIGKEAVRYLREHKLRSGGAKWVFCNSEGNPLDGDNFGERVLKPALAKAGIERPITFHCFRHTFASLHLNADHNLKWVSRQLGHSKINITLDTYGHLIPEYHGEAVDAYDVLISAPAKKNEKADGSA